MNSTETLPPLVWVDLEMTGLDPVRDHILEIAVVLTDKDLEVIAEGPNRVIHVEQAFFDALPGSQKQWLDEHGLVQDSIESTHTLAAIENEVLAFLTAHITQGTSPLCGNTISKDRAFLERHMPRVASLLHYRNIDVSTIKELARRWRPDIYESWQKKDAHRARDDILESIAELRHYRETFFRT